MSEMSEPEVHDAEWHIALTPDEQAVQITLSQLGKDGVESFTTGLQREWAIAFATSILNAALDICICGGCDDEQR